jgi:hypothetical protein
MSAQWRPEVGGAKTTSSGRTQWTLLSDEQLLKQCCVDTYRARGPGGQKRNKTSSAVRLRHIPSGLSVIAEESRSQHENKMRALRRLRQRLYLQVREPLVELTPAALKHHPDWESASVRQGQLPRAVRQPGFWPTVGLVLDVLWAVHGRVSDAAALLCVSTAQLVQFLQLDPKVWQQVNRWRQQFGYAPLH